jgi:CRP-like cAMP-binding protein
VLRKCVLFNDLDEAQLDILIKSGQTKQFSPGEEIYTKGEPSKGTFCLIVFGRVGVIVESGQIIRGMGSSEVIGEVGTISPQSKRTVTVRTVEPTEIIEWDVNTIKTKLPDLMKKLKDLAWKHVSGTNDR